MREALGLGRNLVATEHLLLALVRVETSATRIMAKYDADRASVRSRVIDMLAVAQGVTRSRGATPQRAGRLRSGKHARRG